LTSALRAGTHDMKRSAGAVIRLRPAANPPVGAARWRVWTAVSGGSNTCDRPEHSAR
jgi:hypothetical protein